MTDEIAILQQAVNKNPEDPLVPFQLGNLLYDAGRREEAIAVWELSIQRDRSNPAVWRNLGMAYYNVRRDILAAKGAYQRALKNSFTEDADGNLIGGDARVLYERDQLWSAKNTPRERLDELEQYPDLIRQRDDLTLEYCNLLILEKEYDAAFAILKERHFQPSDGGEVLAAWTRAQIALGRIAFWRAPSEGGDPALARRHFEAALHPPKNLGATGANQSLAEIHYWIARASRAAGDSQVAETHFRQAAADEGHLHHPSNTFDTNSYFTALALRELGEHPRADVLLQAILGFSQNLAQQTRQAIHLATSSTTVLPFDEDLAETHLQKVRLLEALARQGLGGGETTGTAANPTNLPEKRAAKRLLNDILQTDPGHTLASDLLLALDWT